METLISIIIPVYNVEKYLQRCLESVVSQSYREIEIILVNDGSTDNSGKICEEYALRDERIKVLHNYNQGLSEARNQGIELATGAYLAFIDSDDYIDNRYISYLFELLKKNSADISCCGAKITTDSSNIYNSSEMNIFEKEDQTRVYDTKEALGALCYQKGVSVSAWGKLFKKELFDEIRFPKGKLFEDEAITYLLMDKAEKIVISKYKLYAYYQRKDGIVRSKFDIRKMDYIINTEGLVRFISSNYPELLGGAISKLLWSNLYVLLQMDNKKKYEKEYHKIKHTLKIYRKSVILDKKVKVSNRILLLLTYLGDWPLKSVYFLKNKMISN